MIFTIEPLLTPEELHQITTHLSTADFIPGTATAGWHARMVKQNSQLNRQSPVHQQLKLVVQKALKRNTLFQLAVRPKILHSLLFSRYEVGMFYGPHVDNALMGEGKRFRADVSWTLFLSDPATYGGGELILESGPDEPCFKLAAGSLVVYPSLTLHRVTPVTEGSRYAAVGWVQSLIRDPGEREILFELDVVRRSIFEKDGKTLAFDSLSKCHANLLRRWADL